MTTIETSPSNSTSASALAELITALQSEGLRVEVPIEARQEAPGPRCGHALRRVCPPRCP
jgi:hypothetical protein